MPSISHHAMITGKNIVDETVLRIDIGPDAVGSSELAPGAVAYGTQLVDDVIGSRHIASGAIAYSNQIINDRIGSEHIANDAIGSSAMIGANVIRGYHIITGQIGTREIANDAVGSQHVANDAIGSSAMINADVIRGYHIAAQQIGTRVIGDNAIGSSAMIDANVIRGYHIATQQIGTREISNDAIGSQHIQGTAISYENQIKVNTVGYGRLTSGLQGSLGGMPDTIGTTQLKEPGVGSQNIYNGAVYGTKIAANAVGYGKLTAGLQGSLGGMPDTIGTTQLKEPAVGSTQLYKPAVGSSQLYKPAVGSANLYTGAVYGPKIAGHTIGSQHIITGSTIIQLNTQLAINIIGVKNLVYQYDFGIISSVTKTGKYQSFIVQDTGSALVYGATPTVVLTPVGTINAVLAQDPDVGSFKAQLVNAGTESVHYVAFGVAAAP